MADVQCPYCKAEQDICHDDDYGYEEDKEYEQDCSVCGRTFQYTTAISFYYSVSCSGGHDWKSWGPRHPEMEGCERCGAARLVKESPQ